MLSSTASLTRFCQKNDFINEINKVNYENNLIFFESHDLPRSINNFLDIKKSQSSAKIIALLQDFNNNDNIIYQGQELSVVNKKFISIEDLNDNRSKDYYKITINNGEEKMFLKT